MNIKLRSEHRNKEINYGGSLYPVMQSILMRENPIRRSIEHFWVASLDNKNRLLNVELVNLGLVNRVHVKPPEVFRIPIYKSAPRVVLVHNPATAGGDRHPSGDIGILTPNEADKNFTDHMLKAGKLLNIDVADHLVITETDYYSFKDRGYMLLLTKSGKYEITLAETEEIKVWHYEMERKKGEDKAKREIALRLLELGNSVDDIVKITKLRKSSVEKLKREIKL
jgi:DNA repair protein RadC